jgi:hypothetical protein
MPAMGAETVAPSADTRFSWPPRSVTSIEPSGKKARLHGELKPLAKVSARGGLLGLGAGAGGGGAGPGAGAGAGDGEGVVDEPLSSAPPQEASHSRSTAMDSGGSSLVFMAGGL